MASTVAPSAPTIWLYTNDIPVWLQVLLGITACTATLLLLTCLLLCCMRLCGCWSGNILGVGALRQMGPEAGDYFGCWCCRPPVVANSDGGHYVIQLRKDETTSTLKSENASPRKMWIPHTHPVRYDNQSTK